MKKNTLEINEKIFTVKKQINIQRVIDKLKEAHHMPTPEGKKLIKMSKKLLQKLNIGIDSNEEFLDFLNYAKKLQSFSNDESSLPPVIDEKTENNPDNHGKNNSNDSKNMDNIKEE